MKVEELILLNKAEVRRDSNLMHLYLTYFKDAFGKTPNCASCSFGTDWQKLVSLYSKKTVTLQKRNRMKSIQIKKVQGRILTYKKDGRTFRQYDNILTDEFIKEFISNGTDEEIAERKKMFNFPAEEAKTATLSVVDNGVYKQIATIEVNDLLNNEPLIEENIFSASAPPKKRNRKNRK